MSAAFGPGDLVFARGREWVALPSADPEILRLRPLSGGEGEITTLLPALEHEAPRLAHFRPPDPADPRASQDAAALLTRALAFSLRAGAGPFRSAARLGFEPRAYQLVPLIMALRLPVIRLLIADDVGIGKTIEAGLILREMIDRGEVDRFTILCPPALVEQWTDELRSRFAIDAIAVTAASAARLERQLPSSQSLFDAHKATIVSLDYIKADRRRETFAELCPQFVIVDEAHTCVGAERGHQLRFTLLQRLATEPSRHLLMLTATPHSGKEGAFDRLLSLLDADFSQAGLADEATRIRVARHFVQRRRVDVTGEEWGEERVFPRHETAEAPYPLSRPYQEFQKAVLDYCLGIVEGAGTTLRERHLAFWGTLALMRCAGSSPAAALAALRNQQIADPEQLVQSVYDDEGDATDASDLEPAAPIENVETPGGPKNAGDPALAQLITRAEDLKREADPKFAAVVRQLEPLLEAGANPVLFCRFIATAEDLGSRLCKRFPNLRIKVATGRLSPEERRAVVEDMIEAPQRLLVATDCLSEGINLQSLFDVVVHYDLCWNPTRHQQREGRVDRFGQPAPLVRSVMLYSPDSAIDGAVLGVILHKAESIRKATGVTVPLPEDRAAVTGALMSALLLRQQKHAQLSLDFGLPAEAEALAAHWRDALANERRSRTRFAQNVLKPAEILPFWQRWRALLGAPTEVEHFVSRAMSRLEAPLEKLNDRTFRAPLAALPAAIRDRLADRGLTKSLRFSFEAPPPEGGIVVTRNHPLPANLAQSLLEAALDPASSPVPPLGRSGAWLSPAVKARTLLVLLHLRFKLIVHGRVERLLFAEEADALAFGPDAPTPIALGDAADKLLGENASGNLAESARLRLLAAARERLATLAPTLAKRATERAIALEEDHRRVREAGATVSRVSAEVVHPPDIVGLFVLVPANG